MNSATVQISEEVLFSLMGLKYFDGHVDAVMMNDLNGHRFLTLRIEGNDERLPNRSDYPASNVICQSIESRIQEVC